MQSTAITPRVRIINAGRPRFNIAGQRGVSLIELMVGVAIGLLVVAVAMGALMVSRGISGTVSDASNIQQQAAYAMRVIGLQMRQVGSLYLDPNVTGDASIPQEMAEVSFEIKNSDFDLKTDAGKKLFLEGISTPSAGQYKLTIGYAGYTEASYVTNGVAFRDCLGQLPTGTLLQSRFVLDSSKQELKCAGATGPAQAIVQNVADFQVRYLVQNNANPADARIQYADASAVTNWGQVQAIEVCLVLFGNEPIDMPPGSKYTGCGNDATPANNLIDMTTLTGPRARRMHIAYRNVFQLRSQGLFGTVL